MGMAVKLGGQQKQVPPGVGVTMPPGVGVGTEHAVKCTPLVWTEKNLRTKVSHPAAEPVKTALQHCMKVRVTACHVCAQIYLHTYVKHRRSGSGSGSASGSGLGLVLGSGSGSGSGHSKTRSRPIMSREGLNQSPYDPFSSQSRPQSLGHGRAPVGGEQRLPRTVSTPSSTTQQQARMHRTRGWETHRLWSIFSNLES